MTSTKPPLVYAVTGETKPGGAAAAISARTSRIVFDGSAQAGDLLPSPADLLCAALSACILKNVERFSQLLPFRYTAASIRVEAEREEPPPRIVRMRYVLRVATDEPAHRVELLHTNILKFGTITNTLKAACELHGEIVAEPSASTRTP
jgi:uncharacterized OsmC-like protein